MAYLPFEPAALLPWAGSFALLFAVNLLVSVGHRPLGGVRWLLAFAVACAPALIPEGRGEHPLGILATVVTTFACISAARLPSLDAALARNRMSRFDTLLWMTLPMVQSRPASEEDRQRNRRRAPRFFLWALVKRLAWEPLGYLLAVLPGDLLPWPLLSAFLMLYFVLNLTAFSDLGTGVSLLFGCNVDVLFDAPLLARSPRDFWSRRWNKFISRFALKHVALPLRRRLGPSGVLLSVFAVSGVFHEYFAWGVSGSETHHGAMSAFFIVQGMMVWLNSRWSIPLPPLIGTGLTFFWMMLTAPLFFIALEPALDAFGFPESARPWSAVALPLS